MSSVLDPKVVLVTGASSGIGRATALALSKAGATVAVGGRRTDRLEALAQEAPGEILVLDMDVSDPESVRKAVDRTVERFGTLDIVVNNAGIMLTGPVLDANTPRAVSLRPAPRSTPPPSSASMPSPRRCAKR
ncbi:short subunit dehydrogenase [Streptomyces sp. SLBN-31]|nr:short subunit dehydrogenase [Streptomyces sp. SLBN-31]